MASAVFAVGPAVGLDPRLEVERRLAGLVRSQAPLRRAHAALAGRIVATRAWERLGFARLRDYAVERVGLSARELQDLAHTDAALAQLPQLEAAFVAGELSWTKTRLLCRVAGAGDEARWLALARPLTARALAREVRAVDRGSLEAGAPETDEEGEPAWPTEGVEIRCTTRVTAKFHRARLLAHRAAGQHLPPWACMEAVAAEVLSALPSAPDPGPPGCSEGEGASWADRRSASADELATREAPGASEVCAPASGCARQGPESEVPAALRVVELPTFLRPLVAGLDSADPFELDARLRRAVVLEQRSWAEVGLLLGTVARQRLYLRLGFSSLEIYAPERLGISPRKARALLLLERAARECPALRDAWRSARLSWVQAHALVPLLLLPESRPWRGAWIAWAERVSVRRLEADLDAALLLRETDPAAFAATGGLPDERQTGARPMAPEGNPHPGPGPRTGEAGEGGEAFETGRFFFMAPRDVARLFRAVVCSVRRALERRTGRPASEGEAAEAMFDHAFETWGANDGRVRAEHRVFERDDWRCTVPGCTSYRNLQDHHITFRSAGGSDELANRTTLCAWHHLRGVHAGRVRCVGRAPEELRFDLGLREGRPPLVCYLPGEVKEAPC